MRDILAPVALFFGFLAIAVPWMFFIQALYVRFDLPSWLCVVTFLGGAAGLGLALSTSKTFWALLDGK